jgi:hypothetical protein
MRKLTALCVSALALSLPGIVKAQDKVEVFGGYSYSRLSLAVLTPPTGPVPLYCLPSGCPSSPTSSTVHVNGNGWEASGTFKPSSWFGLAADFSGHYGSTNGAHERLVTFLWGPQLSVPGKISPFGHLLVGGAHESLGTTANTSGPTAANAFAAAAGWGLDIKAAPFVSLRAVQVDYLATRFFSATQNHVRVSAGLVLRF